MRKRESLSKIKLSDSQKEKLNEMWVHSPPLGAQGNFNRKERHDTM